MTDYLPLALFYNLHGWEVLLIFFAILLLFGAKRLPELARGMGKSIREFKKAATQAEESIREAIDLEEPTAPKTATEKSAESPTTKDSTTPH